MAPSKDTLVYAGTYTSGKGAENSNAGKGPSEKSKGIYVYRLQTENLDVSQNITLAPLGLAAESSNPSFLELDSKRRLLFAVNEDVNGAVTSFKINDATGKLTQLSQRSSNGAGPCHFAIDKAGKFLVVANYASGNVAVLPIAPDGQLGDAIHTVQHSGKSTDPQRQAAPHAHCATFSPDDKFVFICDLGADKVFRYRFDPAQGKLSPADPAFTASKSGAGPRHMAFRPDGKFAYVVNELNSTVDSYSYDSATGLLKHIENVSTLPGYYDGPNLAAEIDVHPSDKWLYVSNRGNNTVILFGIDSEKGNLTYIEEQGTGGMTPRHFGIQPNAKHLAIANQNSNTLLACRIDSGNGRLKPSGVFAAAPSPACVKFLPPSE